MTLRLDELWAQIKATVGRRITGEEAPIKTPWAHLNQLLMGGYWAGAHTVISTSGNGKSTFAIQVAVEAASTGTSVFYASLELDNAQIGLRVASCLDAGVRWNDALLGKNIELETLDRIYEEKIKGLPLWIDVGNTDGWDLESLEAWIAEQREHTNATLFAVIDYLQLVRGTEGGEARMKMANIMRRIQNIGRLKNVAILVISSTSRANYSESDVLEACELNDTGLASSGTFSKRDVIMKMAKEAGEIEYGSTTLSALIRDYETGRCFLIIAKRRIADGGVWCSFRWHATGFVEDEIFAAGSAVWTEPT